MSYTEQEFNEAMLFLQGYKRTNRIRGTGHWFEKNIEGKIDYKCAENVGYCWNLNALMPLAWKHDVCILPDKDNNCSKFYCVWAWIGDKEIHIDDKDPIQAIRDCLWQIAQERK